MICQITNKFFFVVIYYCTCNFLFRNALATLNVALYYLDFNQSKRKQTLDKKDLCSENLLQRRILLLFSGLYMVNLSEQAAYSETKVDRPIWDKEDQGPLTREAVEKTMAVPDDLQCPVCRELIKDAVLCPESACEMCDECARESLIRYHSYIT